jgi:hypothetical protein
MTPEDCKIVTEYIGERYSEGMVGLPYRHEGEIISHRDFTTWNDFGAVFEKLVEKGDFPKFEIYARIKYANEFYEYRGYHEAEYIPWLHSQLQDGTFRLCQLVADWLKEKEE